MLPFGSHQAPLYRGSRQKPAKGYTVRTFHCRNPGQRPRVLLANACWPTGVPSHMRNCPSLGPYSRPMPRALWWSQGGGGTSLGARYPCTYVRALDKKGPHSITGARMADLGHRNGAAFPGVGDGSSPVETATSLRQRGGVSHERGNPVHKITRLRARGGPVLRLRLHTRAPHTT
jgi:hypothetical protein